MMTKALFLDIDGVLQPGGRQERFRHENEYPELARRLNKELPGDFDYVAYINANGYNVYDLAAVYYDWDKPAVERLREILDTTGAKIVLSTTWRRMGIPIMRALMAIHHLDSYLVDSTFCITHEEAQKSPPPYEKMNASRTIFENIANNLRLTVHNADPKHSDYVDERAAEIREYLDRHPEIIAYVTVDDMYLENGLEGHFVSTDYRLEDEHVRKCVDILNNEDGPYPLNKEEYASELEAWREKYVY